jgi:Dolichyl-phosphate-mannose-protein mannosyltransferase
LRRFLEIFMHATLASVGEAPAPAATAARGLSLEWLIGISGANLALHLAAAGNYGFFRDELYYIACSRHLAWGYVDQPPLIAAIAWFARHSFGNSLFAARILPALAGAALVFLTGWFACRLGGGRYAQALAALTVLFAPAILAMDSFLSMNAFEPVIWLAAACILLRILEGADPRWWLAFGALCGVGLLNKHTMLVFGFAAVCGLLLSGERRRFANKWTWLGAGVALLIFMPNLVWEARHAWPQIEVVRHARALKNVPISHSEFLFEEILFLNPLAAPVWMAGLAWYFMAREARRFRCFGWMFAIIFAVFFLLHGKTYYPLPAYPMVIAAGGVALERFFADSRRRRLAAVVPAALVASGLAMLPFGVPVLPVKSLLRYEHILPLNRMVKTERDAGAALPQLYADMFGWHEMTATIAQVYHSLSLEDQARCAILTGNYGEAGAIDEFGPRYGLPPAISAHNSYWLWGPRGYSGDVVILFGPEAEPLRRYFRSVRQVAVIHNPYAMPLERNLPVYLCRYPVEPLAKLWPRWKLYI